MAGLNKWLGIDLGTYNSSAAIKTKSGKVEIVKNLGEKTRSKVPFFSNQEKYKEFPSFISFDKDGLLVEVGINSKEKASEEPEFVVWGIKRLLGKSYSELKNSGELDRFPYRIKPDRRTGHCLIVVGEKSYSPVELCAEIFKKIKSDAEKIYGNIDSTVVSVPAYYDPIRVTPIVDAARNAGFVNVKTIPEPVAAALAFNLDITVKPKKTLVFDLGAGTLDVTAGYLLRQPDRPNEFNLEVIKNTGDPKLGGMDMDDRIINLIKEKCELSEMSSSDMSKMRRSAEKAKILLSEETKIEYKINIREKEFSCSIDQFELKSAFEGSGFEKNLLESCRLQIMSAINESNWSPNEVEILIMIGGPTKLQCINEIFQIVFHSNPTILQQLDEFYSGEEKVDRMTAVSIGAAMSIDRKVDDKVPHGHGFEDIEINEVQMIYNPEILVPRDSAYPFKSKSYNIPWINLNGLYEFKILQHIPKSEIPQFGYEYKFVGIQKFAVKNPNNCIIAFQMGYNENKELEVRIKNALSSESVHYIGINQSTSIGMKYPLTVKKPPEPEVKNNKVHKVPPSDETLEDFGKWVQNTVIFIKRKIDNFPVPQMLILQILDEIETITNKGGLKSNYEMIFTKINSLIWNSNSRGLLTNDENVELTNRLSDFEGDLFRFKLKVPG